MFNKNTVTVLISTKDRYESLYATLLCVVNQTLKPDGILILDDSVVKKDVRLESKWVFLFNLLDAKKIPYSYLFTDNQGQSKNNQYAIDNLTTQYILRLDDDVIFDNNLLESLMKNMKDGIGAIGPRVITPGLEIPYNHTSGRISNIFSNAGIQLAINGSGLHEVEHLHCSFLFDRSTHVRTHTNLSPIGFREDTILSHNLFKKGLKLIVDLDVAIYHHKSIEGGSRTLSGEEYQQNINADELKFHNYLSLPPIERELFFLDSGIGDHFAFKSVLRNLPPKSYTISCCYPDVFFDMPHLKLISIAEGKMLLEALGDHVDRHNIYGFMFLKNYTVDNLPKAYSELYNIPEKVRNPEMVSVIIPMYNAEKTIINTVNGVLEQSHSNFEIIIVDDCSEDASIELLNNLHSNLINAGKIKIITKEQRTGYPSVPRNIGLSYISSESSFIAYCDADDFWQPNHLEICINELNAGADMVYTKPKFYNEIGEEQIPYGIPVVEEFDYEALKTGNYIFISSVVLKREVYETIGKFDETYKNLEDYDMWLRVAAKFTIKAINLTTISYLVKAQSTYYTEQESEGNKVNVLTKNNLLDVGGSGVKYSVVIGTYNHLQDCLVPCLESLFIHSSGVEVIVVANGCTDGTVDYLKRKYINVPNNNTLKIMEFPEPMGFAKAYNAGIKEASGEYIVLLNNDTLLLEQETNKWLDKLAEPIFHDSIGITGPLMSVQNNIPFMVFFCVMIHKSVFNSIGYIDENFNEGYGEDIDFCKRANDIGIKLYQVPPNGLRTEENFMVNEFPIYHVGERTVHELSNWEEIKKNNTIYLLEKHAIN